MKEIKITAKIKLTRQITTQPIDNDIILEWVEGIIIPILDGAAEIEIFDVKDIDKK